MVETEHKQLVKKIREYIKTKNDYYFPKSTSMPLGCSIKERIYIPDIIVMKNNNIEYIIEPECGTGGTTICGKIVLANKAIEKMINSKIQSPNIKPKLIFLYKSSYPKNDIQRVKYRVKEASIKTDYLKEVFIDYFSSDWKWFDE